MTINTAKIEHASSCQKPRQNWFHRLSIKSVYHGKKIKKIKDDLVASLFRLDIPKCFHSKRQLSIFLS